MKVARLSALAAMMALALSASAGIQLPDSMIREENVYQYSISSPDTARAILQALQDDPNLEDWHLNFIEGNYHVNQRQFRKAFAAYTKALNDPGVSFLPQTKIQILMRLIAVDDHLQDDDDLMEHAYQMEQIAKDVHDECFLYTARFVLAKRRQFMGDSSRMGDCHRAIEEIIKSEIPYKNNLLCFCYADMVRMYETEGKYDEALRMSFIQEEMARNIAPISVFHIDGNVLRKAFAMRACLYAMMGRMDDAAVAYRQWKDTPYPNAADDRLILDYLMADSRFDEALQVVTDYKHYLVQEGDSISYWMIYALCQESIIMDAQDKPKEAASLNAEMFSISQELHKIRSRELMDATYAYMQQLDERNKNYLTSLYIGGAIIVLLIFLVASIIYNRKIRQRNKQLAALVNGIEAYRYMLDKNENNSAATIEQRIQEFFSDEQNGNTTSDQQEEHAEEEKESDREALQRYKLSEDDKQLFVLMDRLVERDKLFLNPNLSREDLLNLLGIDKNRFGKMMSHYSTASNASSYISAKRAEYAAELLRKHPEYTIAAIAEMCGMSNTVTLNRTFKQLYGVTPSEYRSNYDNSEIAGGDVKK